MSEKRQHSNEFHRTSETAEKHEISNKGAELEINQEQLEANKRNQIEQARREIESESKTKPSVIEKISEEPNTSAGTFKGLVSNELKDIALRRELKHIQKNLNKPDQFASKLIHQKSVRVISDASSKTISRPSGLLGGGITAFLGTLLYYGFTVHIGVKYNYFVFIVLFIAGFVIGLSVEMIVWAFATKNTTV